MSSPTRFNLRVYGLCLNKFNEILLVDELIKGAPITKFPGGGLELGEGVADCMVREWKEETGQDLIDLEHFYTTDYFQQSYYNPNDQIISIYYRVWPDPDQPLIQETGTTDIQGFRWAPLSDLSPSDVTLPIDQRALELFLRFHGQK